MSRKSVVRARLALLRCGQADQGISMQGLWLQMVGSASSTGQASHGNPRQGCGVKAVELIVEEAFWHPEGYQTCEAAMSNGGHPGQQ